MAVTHAMEISPQGLYFLISLPRAIRPSQALLVTDFDGTVRSFAPISKPVVPNWLQIDSTGNIDTFVHLRHGNVDRAEIYEYTPKFGWSNVIPVEEFTFGVV